MLYLNSGVQFSGSEGQFTDTGSQGRTVLTQTETSGSFGAVNKAADTEFSLKFAGDDSAILVLICDSASFRFRFPT